MWCLDCKQDVPAVARSASEPLICPRCEHELEPATTCVASVASDAGIALDSFDQPSKEDLAPPIDWVEQERTRQRLREIDRRLSTPTRPDAFSAVAPGLQRSWMNSSTNPSSSPLASAPVPALASSASNVEPLRAVARHAVAEPTLGRHRTKTSWLLSVLLGVGVLAFCVGLGLLVWSGAFQLPQLWQQGMALTIGAEGLLILSLTWMAARLWRNGRCVNRQLHGVDRQLAEIEQITGSLAGSHAASSQHYYHHFSQAASPHMLVANLQGQVDQLAARIQS